MSVQWFPGHMSKAIRQIKEKIKVIDCLIEIVDARAPLASRNPELTSINKPRLIIMSKIDLADPSVSKKWYSYFKSNNVEVLEMDLVNNFSYKLVLDKCETLLREKIAKDKEKGLRKRPIRAMVIGIPNVGKSTFINKMSKRKATGVGNIPGFTKGQQWVRSGDIELLDTPGVLWHKFEDEQTGIKLALVGTVKETILNKDKLSDIALNFLISNYPKELTKRYNLNNLDNVFYDIAINRGLLISGGEPSIDNAKELLLHELKNGIIGRISLEKPGEQDGN
jgi:ribosome biogenesis GTPase A